MKINSSSKIEANSGIRMGNLIASPSFFADLVIIGFVLCILVMSQFYRSGRNCIFGGFTFGNIAAEYDNHFPIFVWIALALISTGTIVPSVR